VFRAGRVEQVDSPTSLYENPATPFVAGFIGESNRLTGKLVEARDGIGTVAVNGLGHVQALCTQELSSGIEVIISIRPERLVIAGTAENSFEGRVEETIYLGTHLRIRVTVSSDVPDLNVLVPVGAAELFPVVGEAVRFSWATRHARILSGNDDHRPLEP
jgi:putative spermidine/putrescine transport system ATP-binding protein